MARCATQLTLLAASMGLTHGARFHRSGDAAPAKTIAGVPVLNYHLAYGGDMEVAGTAEARWVVVLKEGTTDQDIEKLCKSAKGGCSMLGHPDAGTLPVLTMVGTEGSLEDLLTRSGGQAEFVEPDLRIQLPKDESPEPSEGNSAQLASWGLSRVGVDRTSNKGKNTHIYVFDTGLRHTHRDFGGRAIATLDVAETGRAQECNGNINCARDRLGHGTHCAATAAGTTYGVASQALVYSVKILSDEDWGYWSWSYEGLDWVTRKGRRPFVASLSLQGEGVSSGFQRAIDKAVDNGLTVVVAGGNYNMDACEMSPAYVTSAITVGSTTSNDARSGFSNFGTCIDIWAPGSRIQSAYYTSDTAEYRMSGTSMACPLVSGAAALRLSNNPGRAPRAIRDGLLHSAILDQLSGLTRRDTNALLWVGR